MRKCLLILFFAFAAAGASAAQIDTVAVFSAKMQREIPALVVVPDAGVGRRMPVLYLLHGFGGSYTTWQNITDLRPLADACGMIVVCPDGANSWYWDSPLNKEYRYETFVSKELVNYIDKNFTTKAERGGRAVTGLSMGGHGSLWLSIRHKDVCGGGGSMSGGLDIRPFPNNWEMKKQLGEEASNKQRWDEHTVINQLDKIKNGDLAVIIDCGCDDFFLEVNKAVHEKLLKKKINHDFIIRPGGHTGRYWNNAIDDQILFFSKFFNKSK